jgi:rhodanese-related sulfurtransferase
MLPPVACACAVNRPHGWRAQVRCGAASPVSCEDFMSRTTPDNVTELTPAEVKSLLDAGKILLIDVREPQEYAAERIPGALLYPLSTFDPALLPADEGRQVVFHCAAGGRSLTAARTRIASGQPGTHLAGGIGAWKAQGLPVIRIDPRTGQPI